MLSKKKIIFISCICCAYISIFHSISDKHLKCIELDTSSHRVYYSMHHPLLLLFTTWFPFSVAYCIAFHFFTIITSLHPNIYICLLWPLISFPRQRFQFKHTHSDVLLCISHVDFIKKEGKTISILLYSILGQSVTRIFTGEVHNTIFDDVPFHVI